MSKYANKLSRFNTNQIKYKLKQPHYHSICYIDAITNSGQSFSRVKPSTTHTYKKIILKSSQ